MTVEFGGGTAQVRTYSKRPAASVSGTRKEGSLCMRVQPSTRLFHASHTRRCVLLLSTTVSCANCGLLFQGDAITSLVHPALPLAGALLPRVVQTTFLCTVK